MIKISRAGKTQAGQALIIFALAMVALIGLASLAIEGGVAEGDRRFLQAVSDASALAGAQHLNKNPTIAQQQDAREAAILYALSGLAGGTVATLPGGCTGSADIPQHAPSTSPCDPDSGHALMVTTPYNGNKAEILVKIDHPNPLELGSILGLGSIQIASRSVALETAGGQPFAFAVYTVGDLNNQGSNDMTVQGNVYAGGCINFTTGTSLLVGPSLDGVQAGTVESFGEIQAAGGNPPWTKGGPSGQCKVEAYTLKSRTGFASNGAWGASGHATGAENCGPTGTNFAQACPSGEPPVPSIGVPQYNPKDPYTCDKATPPRPAFVKTGAPAQYHPGCYDPCKSSGGNGAGNLQPDGVVPDFLPGTYAFFPESACTPVVNFAGGSYSNATSGGPNETGVAGAGISDGVTFFLYNGTSFCDAGCGGSSSGTFTLNAPTKASNNPNLGMLIYNCPTSSSGNGCGTGGGSNFNMKGPHFGGTLKGLIYSPGGSCTTDANATLSILGQVVCHDGDFQAGASAFGPSVTFGGPALPVPIFLTQLIE